MYMDPQKLSQLDPKLRDAYQRVMGTVIPDPQVPVQAQTPPPPAAPIPDPTPIPQPQPEPVQAPAVEPTPTIEEPTIPPAEPPSIPSIPQQPISEPELTINPQPQAANFVQMNSEISAAPAVAATSDPNFAMPAQAQTATIKKKSNALMPILFVIAGVVFIVIYALFWTKVFNLKLPFLG